MDWIAGIFLVFFVVLIGRIPLLILIGGITSLFASVTSLLEIIYDFIHRNNRTALSSTPKAHPGNARYVP